MRRETAVVVSLVSGSEFINHMYLSLLPPILGTLVLEFDVSLAALGFAIGLQAFVNTAFQLPFGHLADTYDRTLMLGICLFLGAAGTFVLAFAPSYEWLLVGQVILGVGIAGHHPAHYPLLSDATTEEYRGRAFSVLGFAANLGFGAPAAIIVGVTLLPGLIWRDAFALIGVVGLLYAILGVYVLRRHVSADVRLPTRSEPADEAAAESTPGLAERIRPEVRRLVESPIIVYLGVLSLVISITMWGVASFLVTLLEQGYGASTSVASFSLSAMFVAGAVYKLVGGVLADRFGSAAVLVASGLLTAAFTLLLSSLVIPVLVAVVVGIVGGNVVTLANPARDKLTDLLSARDELGRNFAIITIGLMIGNTVAPPLFGFVIDSAGFRAGFVAVAASGLLLVVITVAILRVSDGELDAPSVAVTND